MAVPLPVPGITVVTGSASVAGALPPGLYIFMIGSAPKGPAWPVSGPIGLGKPSAAPVPMPSDFLVNAKVTGFNLFGNDTVNNDLNGFTIPPAMRIVFENVVPGGNTPNILPVRVGTTQADIGLPNTSGSPGGSATWHATARQTLGGSMGNGITCQVGPATTFTVTSSAAAIAAGYPTETYTIASGATWATIAALVNAQSKLVWLSYSGTDAGAIADVTLATLVGGTDGASPSLAQINAAVDSLSTVVYGDQPMNIILPLFADTAAGGAAKRALTDAIANLTNGQRAQVIGCVSPSIGGGGNLATITAIATDLIPSENGGDSGRATLMANNLPYRIDPATSSERLYPAWMVSAAFAGLIASVPIAQPVGRAVLQGFTKFAENYSPTDRATLHSNGVTVARPLGRLVNQATTANQTSYRREQNVQRAEDFWVADLANFLDNVVIEQVAGLDAGSVIYTLVDNKMRNYVQAKLIGSYAITIHQNSVDARIWEVDITYNPILPVSNINPLNVQLQVIPQTTTSQLVTL